MTKGVIDRTGAECACAQCRHQATQRDWAASFFAHVAMEAGLDAGVWLELESADFQKIVDAKKTN